MRLTRLQVQNHNRLADLEIEVRDHLVLIGANDVGKSSLLRCVDLLLGASTAQLYSHITPEDFNDRDQPFIVEADIEGFSDDDKALFPDEIVVDPGKGKQSLTIRLVASIDSNETLTVERSAPGGGTGRQLSRDQLIGLGWKYLSATAQTRDLGGNRRSAVDELLQSVDLGTEQAGFDDLAELLVEKLEASDVLSSLRTDLATQLSRALPVRVEEGDLSFVPGAAADNDVLSDVRLQVHKNGTPQDISAQSDGTRALYAIALYDLMSLGANMVCIDEPEVHLHPTSQRSLARLLQTSPNQKMMATHSADIVGMFDPDSIVVVRANGVVVQPNRGFLSEDEKMSAHWWVRNKLEPLTSRRVVAVEGISDRIILERIADVTDRNLDRLGVSIIETGGAGDMGAVEKLFGLAGFNIPISMLIDADAAAATASKLGIPVCDLPNHSVWVSGADLEDEYVKALGAAVVWAGLQASSLFNASELANCQPTGTGGAFLNADVATFCRRKRSKVKAAMVVAPLLDAATASLVTSIDLLLTEISGS